MDPNRVYLQLTSVHPHFDKNEINRENDFEKSQHVSTFVYSTPFTKEGKARTDDVTKQWITQNLIETEASFPYCKKRILVLKEHSKQIGPSQIAINALEKKNRELNEGIG